MAIKQVHAIVEGRVQGVFFRAYTKEEADRLGLAGWVRNRPDGSVEVLMQGEDGKVEQMLNWLHRGSPYANVIRVRVTEEEAAGDLKGFKIQYY